MTSHNYCVQYRKYKNTEICRLQPMLGYCFFSFFLSFFSFFHIGTVFMFVCTSKCALNYYILTYLFCLTVIHLLYYFMLCAFVTYSIKLLFTV